MCISLEFGFFCKEEVESMGSCDAALGPNARFYLVNVVLPVASIVFTSISSFAVWDDMGGRLGTTLTLMLTAVAYKYLVAEMVPSLRSYINILQSLFAPWASGLLAKQIGMLWGPYIFVVLWKTWKSPSGKYHSKAGCVLILTIMWFVCCIVQENV